MVDEPWHLDKRIPVAFIFALLGQAAVFIWFASALFALVNENASDIQQHDLEISQMMVSGSQRDVQAAAVRAELSEIQRRLARMEDGQLLTIELIREGLRDQN